MTCFKLLCIDRPALNQQSLLEVDQLPGSRGHFSTAAKQAGDQVFKPECTTALCVRVLASGCSSVTAQLSHCAITTQHCCRSVGTPAFSTEASWWHLALSAMGSGCGAKTLHIRG